MMQHGALRVALCFLAKFGLFYFFMTSILAFASMCFLMMYYTNVSPDGADGSSHMSKPVAPSNTHSAHQGAANGNSHLHITSNLKYRQESEGGSLIDITAWGNYGRDLMSFVNQTSMLPSCTQGSLLTILITSAPRNFKYRSAIRETWCSKNTSTIQLTPDRKRNILVQCVFLLGKTLSRNIQKSVEMESQKHDDILQGTYLDTYRNLTLKVLNGFHWSSTFCPSSYVLKTDDDCFVNVPVLTKTLQDQEAYSAKLSNLYVGHVMSGQEVIRNPRSKWEVSNDDFRASHYPAYISGSGYLLSSDLVDIIGTFYQSTYFIPIEDAYVGILLNSVGVVPQNSARFSVYQTQLRLCNFLYLIITHKVSPASQSELMEQSLQSYAECTDHQAIFDWN